MNVLEDIRTDTLGNPLVVHEGCESATTCALGRRFNFTYRAGTDVVATAERPSAKGGTDRVTDSKQFVTGSLPTDKTRVSKDERQGYTAGSLSGALDTIQTRTTDFTYIGGGGVNATDLATVDGPYVGSPDGTQARTTYAYYAPGALDECSQTVPSPDNNKYRVKTVTRWIDGTRSLTSKRCNYDGRGLARTVRNAEGTETTFTFDMNGNVLTSTLDPAGLNLQSSFTYDGSNNVLEIRLPRTTVNGRTGFKYEYDSAGNVQYVRQGYFTGAGAFMKLQSMHYVYDSWGNRITTEYLDASDTAVVTESSKYDAFSRLVELAHPANSSTNRTLYSYDPEGNLLQVSDHQGDDVKYVDKDNPTNGKYDRFGRVSQIEQEICAHPSGSENGGCTDTTPAKVQYSFDPAGQLAEVRLKEPRVAGNDIVTTYVTDDFGSVVKVISPDATAASFFRYDGAGRLLEAKDPRNKIYRFRYDRLGRLVAKINMTAGGDPNSVVCNGDTEARCEIIYCYDDQDASCGFSNGGGTTHAERLSAVNDKAGKLEFDYDKAGRMTEERRTMLSGAQFNTRYLHDANGNVIETTYPWAGAGFPALKSVKSFDEANRETAVSFSGPGGGGDTAFVNDIQWYPFGGLKSWKPAYSQFKIELIQETGSGRLTEIKMTDGAVTKEQILYSYAYDGNVTSQSSAHDSLSRLTSSNSRSFGYDDAGNRTSGPSGTYSYASATNNKLTTGAGTSYSFDAAGNVTARGSVSLTVADDGTVSAIQTGSGTTTYTRDHRNLRIDKAGAGGAGTYFYDPSGNMIQWTGPTTACNGCAPGCGSGKTITPFENYIYVDGRRLGYLATRRCSGGNLYNDGPRWFFPDRMDMPRALYKTQSSSIWSATFDAFADGLTEQVVGGLRVPFRLPGQFALTTQEGGPSSGGGGLVENWNRVYDTAVGRYLEPDPAGVMPLRTPWPGSPFGMAGGMNQSYGYGAQSPLRYIDRSGARPGEVFWSPDAAATDALDYIAENHGGEDMEYGGWIVPEDDGFTYWEPTPGGPDWWQPGPRPDSGFAPFHSHGCEEPGGPFGWFPKKHENFSRDDRDWWGLAQRVYGPMPIYLGTPRGAVKKLGPGGNTDTLRPQADPNGEKCGCK